MDHITEFEIIVNVELLNHRSRVLPCGLRNGFSSRVQVIKICAQLYILARRNARPFSHLRLDCHLNFSWPTTLVGSVQDRICDEVAAARVCTQLDGRPWVGRSLA